MQRKIINNSEVFCDFRFPLCPLSVSPTDNGDFHTENSRTVLSLPSLMVSVMTSSFSRFISVDLGLVVLKLAKFFFGGYFFLPAALKLPVITGLIDYQK